MGNFSRDKTTGLLIQYYICHYTWMTPDGEASPQLNICQRLLTLLMLLKRVLTFERLKTSYFIKLRIFSTLETGKMKIERDQLVVSMCG